MPAEDGRSESVTQRQRTTSRESETTLVGHDNGPWQSVDWDSDVISIPGTTWRQIRNPCRYSSDSDPTRHDSLRNGSVASEYSDTFETLEEVSKIKQFDEKSDDLSESSGNLPGQGDLEAGLAVEKASRLKKYSKTSNLVSWDGPQDPLNPKNWSIRRKWAATIVVGSFTLLSPIASSMCAPALSQIAKDFDITNDVESQLVLSVFVLAYAFGPLILGPLSEVFGRVLVLQLSNAFFATFNLACGFAQNEKQIIAFRFLSGLGGSAPLAIGGAVIGDCWHPNQRGKAIAIFSSMPLIATAIGPLAGGFVTQHTTWRWVFFSITIACILIQVVGIFALKESFAPEVLRRKKNALIIETGNTRLFTEYEQEELTVSRHLSRALRRPFRLLFTQPIVQVMAIYIAYVYGLIYLVMSTFSALWSSPEYYGESVGTSGLNYISLALGYAIGGQICAMFIDRIYRRLKDKYFTAGRSEFRLPLSVPASLIMPIGLFCYGWTAETRQHWILPNIGALFFSLGGIIVFQCIQTYIVDAYTTYAASALAAAVVLRSLCGFVFPLFAPYMYRSLGYGWGNSLLGFAALLIGVPAPLVLWKYGERLRAISKFCAGG